MKSFKQHLNERTSQTLFHGTVLYRAVSILQNDFLTTSEPWSKQDFNLMGKYTNFLSTTRTLNSGYIKNLLEEDSATIVFALDGAKLSNSFKIMPYNFYAGYNSDSEAEDRILTNQDKISLSKYCVGCYAYFDREFLVSESEEEALRNHSGNFETYIFENKNDFLTLNKSKGERIK